MCGLCCGRPEGGREIRDGDLRERKYLEVEEVSRTYSSCWLKCILAASR